MGDGGEVNNSETFLEGVDAAGESLACGEVRVTTALASLGGEAGTLLSLLFSLGGNTGPGPGLF